MPSYESHTRNGTFRIHGDLGDHCADCSDVASVLCDFPIGGDLTCDRKVCERHARVVGDDMHYCLTHHREYLALNPDKPEYRLTQLRLKTLPGFAHAALSFLKEAFDHRDTGHRGPGVEPFLRNSAIPLGEEGVRAGRGPVEDAPYDSLAGGLQWCLHYGLVEVCWRKPPGYDPQPWFALTMTGLRVIEGEVVELPEQPP